MVTAPPVGVESYEYCGECQRLLSGTACKHVALAHIREVFEQDNTAICLAVHVPIDEPGNPKRSFGCAVLAKNYVPVGLVLPEQA